MPNRRRRQRRASRSSSRPTDSQRRISRWWTERLECFHCHGGFNFADAVDHARLPEPERAFHNNGLYNLDGKGAYPASDQEEKGDVLAFLDSLTDESLLTNPALSNPFDSGG
jgi:cytochrome c peroxidase